MTQTDPVLAQLTGPGGPFEIVVEDILGNPTHVYKQRMHSLRELMEANAARAESSWAVAWAVSPARLSSTALSIRSSASIMRLP